MTALSNFAKSFYLFGLPVPLAFANGLLDKVDGGMILVGSDFVTNQMPHAFLSVQFRMIGRQVLESDVGTGVEEFLNPFAFVPRSPVDVEVDFHFPDSMAEVV